MIYLFVFILLLFLSFRYDINGKSEGRDNCYYLVLVILILIAGLRWRLGSDTPSYIYSFYHETPVLSDYFEKGVSIKYPLWVLLNSVVFTIGGKFFWVQIIHATFVNTLYFKYIKKHSPYIFTCALLYYVWMFTNQNMETMKASMAIVVCLFGNDCMLEKKRIKGILLYFLACLFHFSAALLFLTPFLLFLRFNKIGLVVLFLTYIIGGIIQASMGEYLMIFDFSEDIAERAETYVNSDTYGASKNIMYFFINVLPFIVYSILSVLYLKKKKKGSDLLKYEPYLVIGMLFMILKNNVFIFYRYVQFYYIYVVLFVAYVFIDIIVSQTRLNKVLALARAIIVFFPILIIFSMYNITRKPMYYPYSSVIERSINTKRERNYSSIGHFLPPPNKNEY